MIQKKKIIRTVTVPQSISFFENVMIRMNEEGYKTVVVTSPGKALEDFKARHPQEKTIEVAMERHISIFKDLKSLWQMIKVMRKEKPYIVHSMTPKAGLISMIAAWITKVPFRIHTFTGLIWPNATGIKRKIIMATDWITCACATHIIPEGEGVLNDLKNNKICHKPLKVLGYGNVKGVDMTRFDPNRFAEIEKDKSLFRFVFVGRIVGDKGINELVDAFTRLNKKYPNTRLHLVGIYEEDLDPIHPNTLKSIEKNYSIQACGPKYGDQLLMEYIKSDCFVLPSYREGFPNVVLEAGAMGLPSIVTDVNGSREIIEHSKNGLIIPPKDADALYCAMETILLDKDLYLHMSSNSRPMIESRYEQGFVQNCLLNFYNEIMQ